MELATRVQILDDTVCISLYANVLEKGMNPSVLLSFPRECPHGVMVKAMDCEIIVSEFELQLRYYVHFRANTFGKGMNPLILPAMG